MDDKINWKRLTSEIKSCKLCEGMNSEKLGTLNAPGYGNRTSRLVLIGQSLCGKPCIDAQIPFTGGAGRILDQSFEKAGVQKKDIYITNVVKCHPLGNRMSKEHEIANCTPYLEQELRWISPDEIVCLGKDAWGYFDETVSSPCDGEIKLNERTVKIHFMYHPAYIMRNPKKKREEYINNLVDVIQSSMVC
jgi:uracil-DNA glycosylase family 4